MRDRGEGNRGGCATVAFRNADSEVMPVLMLQEATPPASRIRSEGNRQIAVVNNTNSFLIFQIGIAAS